MGEVGHMLARQHAPPQAIMNGHGIESSILDNPSYVAHCHRCGNATMLCNSRRDVSQPSRLSKAVRSPSPGNILKSDSDKRFRHRRGVVAMAFKPKTIVQSRYEPGTYFLGNETWQVRSRAGLHAKSINLLQRLP
jgi:hypothetical protein